MSSSRQASPAPRTAPASRWAATSADCSTSGLSVTIVTTGSQEPLVSSSPRAIATAAATSTPRRTAKTATCRVSGRRETSPGGSRNGEVTVRRPRSGDGVDGRGAEGDEQPDGEQQRPQEPVQPQAHRQAAEHGDAEDD